MWHVGWGMGQNKKGGGIFGEGKHFLAPAWSLRDKNSPHLRRNFADKQMCPIINVIVHTSQSVQSDTLF
jgi:hypothetical protein